MRPWTLSPDQKLVAAKRYSEGRTLAQVGEELGVSPQAVSGLLRRRGITLRSASERHRSCSLNPARLARRNRASTYWLGFLFADGTVVRRAGAPELALVLAVADQDHVERFRAFVGSTHKIVYARRALASASQARRGALA